MSNQTGTAPVDWEEAFRYTRRCAEQEYGVYIVELRDGETKVLAPIIEADFPHLALVSNDYEIYLPGESPYSFKKLIGFVEKDCDTGLGLLQAMRIYLCACRHHQLAQQRSLGGYALKIMAYLNHEGNPFSPRGRSETDTLCTIIETFQFAWLESPSGPDYDMFDYIINHVFPHFALLTRISINPAATIVWRRTLSHCPRLFEDLRRCPHLQHLTDAEIRL